MEFEATLTEAELLDIVRGHFAKIGKVVTSLHIDVGDIGPEMCLHKGVTGIRVKYTEVPNVRE